MTPEFIRNQLFKPFQTTKAEGMGIGMFETQQYIHDLGGKLLVDSEPGRGTRIEVCLPVAEGVDAPARAEDKVLWQ